MNNNMPRTPLSTQLSKSTRETEIRIRNIFSGPKKRPPALFLALMFSICVFCGNLVSCQVAETEANGSEPAGPLPAEVWLDYLHSPEDMPWDDSSEIELPEYPGVTFRWTSGSVSTVEDGVTFGLFSGMPVWNVFLCDLNGDGLRELCATVSYGSGMIDEHIMVFDYASDKVYALWNRGEYDYVLSLEDGHLQVTKSRYMGQMLSTGHLAIDYDTIQTVGEVSYGTLRLVDEVPVPTDDPDLAWFLMREHDNYSYSAEFMSSQLLLSQEGEGCTLALALVDGRQHPAGFGNLMLGVWGLEKKAWLSPIYEVGGDDGLFSSWTAEDGSLHILCANTVTYQGDETSSGAAHFRFDGKTLEELKRWGARDLGGGVDIKMVPAEGGMDIYTRNPQYDLQHYNPDYDGVPLPDQWVYSRFEPVTD